jgi:hypothetical protein
LSQVTTNNGRYYEFGGQKFPSVTTILSKALAKPGLVPWASKMVAEGAIRDFDYWTGLDDEEAIGYLSGLPNARRNTSAVLGNVIHAAAESYSLTGELAKPVSDEAAAYLVGFNQFIVDHKPKFLLTEQAVFNRTYRYAGTLDSLVRIGRTVWILDTKTGNRVYPEVALQLAAYANAEFIGRDGGLEEPMPQAKKGGVLHLTPEGYHFIPVRIDSEVFDTFLSAIDMFNWSWGLSGAVLLPEKKVNA